MVEKTGLAFRVDTLQLALCVVVIIDALKHYNTLVLKGPEPAVNVMIINFDKFLIANTLFAIFVGENILEVIPLTPASPIS
jgi:hypothetical protein